MAVSSVLEPLIARKIFTDQEAAVRELARDYILRQIEILKVRTSEFERKYGMSLGHFNEYMHERSTLLSSGQLSEEQKRSLGQAIMQEEDDWLDWKAAQEMLDSWLGLRVEIQV